MLIHKRPSDRPADAAADGAAVGLAAVLARIEQKQDRILALLEARGPRRPDMDRDARLLSAIAATFGGAVFSGRDVLAAAGELPELVAGVDGRALGAWLRRLRARPVPPYRLRWVGREGGGTVWALDVSGDVHTLDCRRAGRGAE